MWNKRKCEPKQKKVHNYKYSVNFWVLWAQGYECQVLVCVCCARAFKHENVSRKWNECTLHKSKCVSLNVLMQSYAVCVNIKCVRKCITSELNHSKTESFRMNVITGKLWIIDEQVNRDHFKNRIKRLKNR